MTLPSLTAGKERRTAGKESAALNLEGRVAGALNGLWIGDALAMPVHWYYDRQALREDYGDCLTFTDPKNPHPGSILWRSHWDAPSPELDILGSERSYWGRRGVHYHQKLRAGDVTLTGQLVALTWQHLQETGDCEPTPYLARYIDLLTHPERHRDTYLEECHRGFFTNLGKGRAPERCAVDEKHIGGLGPMLAVALYFAGQDEAVAREKALRHLALTHAGARMQEAAEAVLSVLFPVLQGARLDEVVRAELARQRSPYFGYPLISWLDLDDFTVVGRRLSTACYVEESVPAVLYLALKYADRPEEGLIANTRLGGDNVHRGIVLGALLGAANGASAWPQRWVGSLRNVPDLTERSLVI